jgi:hypothetical protein
MARLETGNRRLHTIDQRLVRVVGKPEVSSCALYLTDLCERASTKLHFSAYMLLTP